MIDYNITMVYRSWSAASTVQ